MTFPLRHVAPSGAPIGTTDLLRWLAVSTFGGDVSESLARHFQERFAVRHSYFTSTGRAGLTLILRAMRRLAPGHRTEVVLPSYTCYSVAASIVKAGLRPRVVDISPDTLDYAPARLEQADFDRVLAIVATNLYGMPNDLPALAAFARARGAFLVDDAAQAMGASVGGRWSGTWGDAGLFSFDKGKNVSAIDGGVIVTSSDELAQALDAEVAGLEPSGRGDAGVGAMKAVAYALLLRPWLYWIPARVPQLQLGKTVYTTDFPLARPARALTALGLTMTRRLDAFTTARQENARSLIRALHGAPGVRTVTPTPGSTPVYLRLPLLCDDSDARLRTLEVMRAAGIGATGSYPASIADIPELADLLAPAPSADAGRYVAGRIVTLPTHPFVTAGDVSRIASTISGQTNEGRPSMATTT